MLQILQVTARQDKLLYYLTNVGILYSTVFHTHPSMVKIDWNPYPTRIYDDSRLTTQFSNLPFGLFFVFKFSANKLYVTIKKQKKKF